ncbi:MAG: DNA mismatch repair endonuclease MutL [Halanaerobiales bacterium]
MGVIRQLPESVSNQISAGEVIERPASIVKELIENSIDAGSSQILIEIENGGRDSIRVKDNGSGIAEEDMELAFNRYATSKIENVNDLYSIKTLGFRGEALASIASVSKLQIRSRIEESMKGTFMELRGGEITKKEPVGAQIGTDIIIEEIFYNTPARFKYLKTTNTEFGHISSIVSKEAMAYPEIQFRLIHNNNEVLKTPGTGKLLDTIYSIYGQEMVDNLIPIDYEESYVRLSGYIAKPEFTRSSRILQLFFVNNRSIHNTSLNRGVEKGYHGLLPSGRHPVVVLKLKLNQILVDVNVHPTKREVHFSREEIIENVLRKGIKQTLSELNLAPGFKGKTKFGRDKEHSDRLQTLDFKQKTDKQTSGTIDYIREDKVTSDGYSGQKESGDLQSNNLQKSGLQSKSLHNQGLQKNGLQKKNIQNSNKNKIENNEGHIKDKEYNKDEQYKKDEQSKDRLPGKIKKIFGQINNTYILVEGNDGLYIIDQHNAHERVRYENYYKKYNQQEVITQSLLVPVTIDVSLEEKEIINKYMDQMSDMGIIIEPFGGSSFIITELPNFLKNTPAKVIVRDIIDSIVNNGKTMDQAEMIDTIITYMSCRGAIKAGKHLDIREMERIVNDLFTTENYYRCPHGRPIIVHMSNDDIAKSMGR